MSSLAPPSSASGPSSPFPVAGGGGAANAAAVEREQKQLDASLEAFLSRTQEVKTSISALIHKLETDPHLTWPAFLSMYSLLTGQLNSLMKTVKHERTTKLSKYICLPLTLSQDRDADLARMTEQRVHMFSHDLVPNYLRTKPDPEVEAKHAAYEARANAASQEQAQKQYNVMEKVTRDVLKHLNRDRDDLESKANSRGDMEKTYAIDDTYALVAAVSHGRSLKMMVSNPGGGPPAPGGMAGRGGAGPPPGVLSSGPVPKGPGAIKTNIKAASQVHPYARM